MENTILITGVQYVRPDCAAFLQRLETERPDIILTTEVTNDYGIIVRALLGTERCGVVSRLDLSPLLSYMNAASPVLRGKVQTVDHKGRCYTLLVEGLNLTAYETCGSPSSSLWDDWSWMGAPLLGQSELESRLCLSQQIVLSLLRDDSQSNEATILSHLDILLTEARWDVSHETQETLAAIRRLLSASSSPAIQAKERDFIHLLNSFGSQERIHAFDELFLPSLLDSKEAEYLMEQWKPQTLLHSDAAERQLQAIDDALRLLPEHLYYEVGHFGKLMHRLLYLSIPRKKLNMLLSALVLKERLLYPSHGRSLHMREIAKEIAPFFYDDARRSYAFLTFIDGKPSVSITAEACRWIKERMLDARYAHRPLYTVLSREGLYTCSESSWNRQVSR